MIPDILAWHNYCFGNFSSVLNWNLIRNKQERINHVKFLLSSQITFRVKEAVCTETKTFQSWYNLFLLLNWGGGGGRDWLNLEILEHFSIFSIQIALSKKQKVGEG